MRVREVTPLVAQEFVQALSCHYSPKSIKHFLTSANAAWNWGIEMGLVTLNPFRKIPKPFTQSRQRVITSEEFDRLLTATDETFRPFLITLRHSAARPKELRDLTWDRVRFDLHMLVITSHKASRALQRAGKGAKTKMIPIMPPVEKILRFKYEAWKAAGRPQSHVFLNSCGKPWSKDAIVLRMRRLRDKLGMGADAQGEVIVSYSSRHTLLTDLAPFLNGHVLQRWAGHEDPRTTEQYLHMQCGQYYEAAFEAWRRAHETAPSPIEGK
jgi:integrase